MTEPTDPKPAPEPPARVARNPDAVHEALTRDIERWRADHGAAVAAKAAAEAAAASAAEAAEAKAAAAEARANARILAAEMKQAAIEAGIVNPSDLGALDTSKFKLDDKGNLVVPEGFWEAAKAAKPYLFKQTGAQTGNTSSTAAAPGAKPPETKSATAMTREEWRTARAAAIAGR